MIEIKCTTNKAGIRELGKLKGRGNGDRVTVDGRGFVAGTLVFVGFVAPVPHDLSPGPKIWDGVLRFKECKNTEANRSAFGKYVNVPRIPTADPKTKGTVNS